MTDIEILTYFALMLIFAAPIAVLIAMVIGYVRYTQEQNIDRIRNWRKYERDQK